MQTILGGQRPILLLETPEPKPAGEDQRRQEGQTEHRHLLGLVNLERNVIELRVDQGMGQIEIRDRAYVAAGRVQLVVFRRQRAKEIREPACQVSQSRVRVEHVWRGDNQEPARFQDPIGLAKQGAIVFEVLDNFRTGDQIEDPVRIRQRLGVEVHSFDRNSLGGKPLRVKVARGGFNGYLRAQERDEFPPPGANVQMVQRFTDGVALSFATPTTAS